MESQHNAQSTTDVPPETETDQNDPQSSELSLDHIFEILKNSRRREVLHYLKERRERVTLSDLAEHIAALENDTTVQGLSSQQRKRVYVGLYQCHLPKLDDMNIVAFNQSRGHVELGPNAPQLDPYLEDDTEEVPQRPWPRYYLGYAITGLAVTAGGMATGAVGPVLWVGLCLALALGLSGLALFHASAEHVSVLP